MGNQANMFLPPEELKSSSLEDLSASSGQQRLQPNFELDQSAILGQPMFMNN